MRLLLEFSPIDETLDNFILRNKYTIQGFWYSMFLKTENFKELHNKRGFKFFCFSDIYRNDKESKYGIIFSSPIKGLVNELHSVIKKMNYIYIGNYLFKIVRSKKFEIKLRKNLVFETGSPIVVQIGPNKYFNFMKNTNVALFFDRIKDNAIKKYNIFYDDEIQLENEIFDVAEFRKSVAIPLRKADKNFIIIGSMWKRLVKYPPYNRKFYKFLLDAGLGEKNSLGFGFLNQKIHKK